MSVQWRAAMAGARLGLDVLTIPRNMHLVPITLRLDRLHRTFRRRLAGTDSHPFEFLAGKGHWASLIPTVILAPAHRCPQGEALRYRSRARRKAIHHLYNFGYSWDHVIQLEKWCATPTDGLPLLLDATGRCPPEDVGGVCRLPRCHRRPYHPEHENVRLWDPNSSIPTSLIGLRSRPPSTHCPKSGSHAGTSCDQNRRQAPIKRATPTIKAPASSADESISLCFAAAQHRRFAPRL